MKKWNDVYQMVKNGDLDASLLKTGCENLRLGVQKSVEIIPIISMDECWRQQ